MTKMKTKRKMDAVYNSGGMVDSGGMDKEMMLEDMARKKKAMMMAQPKRMKMGGQVCRGGGAAKSGIKFRGVK